MSVGARRQEIIFARHQKECDRSPGWTGAPLIVTSHTWENGKKRAIGSDRTIGELCLARCLASRFVAAAAKDVSDEQEIAAIEWHGDPLVVRSAPRT
jgi:hypothetical protein